MSSAVYRMRLTVMSTWSAHVEDLSVLNYQHLDRRDGHTERRRGERECS